MEESESEPSTRHAASTEERQALRKKNDLLLSRKRIVQQLEKSTDERYSELLRRTLAGLDKQIAALD